MKRFTINTSIAVILGLGIALALLWGLRDGSAPAVAAPALSQVEGPAPSKVEGPRTEEHIETPNAPTAELHVCPSGCAYSSVQDAVDDANDGDVIKVATGIYTGVQGRTAPAGYGGPSVITQVVYISKTVTIRGGYTTAFTDPPAPEANPTTLDAQDQGRVLFIGGNISPTVEGLRITGGDAAGLGGYTHPSGGDTRDVGGGVCVITATATISNCVVTNNTASTASSSYSSYGGGLYLSNSAATLSSNTVQGNIASTAEWGSGGGLYLYYSDATLIGNTIISNTASTADQSGGGGLYLYYSDATLIGNTIINNTASTANQGAGGGLLLFYSAATLSSNTIISNTASTASSSYSYGGGLYLYESIATLSSNTVQGNIANTAGPGCGGGLDLEHSAATLIDNTIISNTASTADRGFGGGLYLDESAATLIGNTIVSNTASTSSTISYGGGLYLDESGATLNGNTVTSNTAVFGGGLHLDGSGATLNGNTVTFNTASSNGGGLRLFFSDATLSGNTVTSNTGGAGGGGLHLLFSDATLSGNTVTSNIAEYGGGLKLDASDATLDDNTIFSNTASSNGGGLYLSYSDATLTGNTVFSNTASSNGGGLFLWSSDAMLGDNTFIFNTAAISGGGMFLGRSHATLTNTIVVDNQANTVGGGLYIERSAPRLLHTTIARNAGGDGSGVYVTDAWGTYSTVAFTNTILVNHSVGITITGGNTVTVNGVLWHNTPVTISRSVTAVVSVHNQYGGDPAFAPDGYHLTANSAAIDKGVDASVMIDIDGQSRPQGMAPDLGADEIIATSVPTDAESTLVYTDTQGSPTVIQVPAEAVTEPITLVYAPVDTATPPSGFSFAGHAFDLEAYRSGVLLPNFTFEEPVTVTIHYTEADVAGLDEDTLVLRYWDGSSWASDGITLIERNATQRYARFTIAHLSEFALFGEAVASSTVDLSIGKVASSNVIIAGERITYTITITNDGPTTPVTAVVVDAWTPITAVAGIYAPGCDVNLPGGIVTCTHTALALGTVYLPSPYLVFTTNATYSGTLGNTAVVTPTGGVTDTNIYNNSTGSVDVTVRGEAIAPDTADLSIGKIASSNVVTAGERITYTITITNDGPTTPVTAVVVDAWTPIAAVTGVYAPGCDVNLPGGVITCTHTALALGTAYLPSPYLVFTTSATYSGTLRNTAVVAPTGGVTDTDVFNNNTGSVDVTVMGEGGYRIYLPLVLRSH